MKRLIDYTNEELSNLEIGGKEYNDLIDIECAHEGVPILPPHPGNEPELPKLKTVKLFRVGGWTVVTESDANKIMKVLSEVNLYDDMGYGDTKRWDKMDSGSYIYPKMTRDEGVMVAEYDKHEKAIEEAKAKRDRWKGLMSNYQSVDKQRRDVVKDVMSAISEANEVLDKRAILQETFARYLELAGGDKKVAWKFLNDAHNLTSREKDEIWPDRNNDTTE